MTTTLRPARFLLAAGIAAAFGLTAVACSSDDNDNNNDNNTTTTTVGGAPNGADADGGEAGSFDGLDDDVVLGAYVTGLEAGFPTADVEVIDDNTIQITFDEGSVDGDGVMSCLVATSALGDVADVVVVYPDGQKTCD